MSRRKRILYITSSYPALNSPEKVFVLPEVQVLLANGFDITLMPVRKFVDVDPECPAEVCVSRELACFYTPTNILISLFKLVFLGEFLDELASKPSLLFRLKFWKESIRGLILASLAKKQTEFDLYYSYWFTGETLGLLWAKLRPVVTRAHGYDLYLGVNEGYIPYRQRSLTNLDRIVVLSDLAKDYLLDIFSVSPLKILVHPLGVKVSHHVTKAESLDQTITFFSCSYPSSVKRLPLIAKFVSAFGSMNKNLTVKWIHAGATLEQLGFENAPSNCKAIGLGRLTNDEILSFYRSNCITFFINLSSSEGLPVSIMEAMSFGVPVIATDVGGVPELLAHGGGILVPKEPNLWEEVPRVMQILQSPALYAQMKQDALSSQRERYCSEKNHADLALNLNHLIDLQLQ